MVLELGFPDDGGGALLAGHTWLQRHRLTWEPIMPRRACFLGLSCEGALQDWRRLLVFVSSRGWRKG